MEKETKRSRHSGFESRRSKILYQITALVVIVLIASGLATFFLVRSSQDRLIEKSIDKLVESEAENISSSYDYVAGIWTRDITEFSLTVDPMEIARALQEKETFSVQEYINGIMGDMIDAGLLDIDLNMLVMVEAPVIVTEPTLYACSDESLIYNWDVPEDLVSAIENGDSYIYIEDAEASLGDLGRQGEQLIVIKRLEDPQFNYVAGFLGFKSIQEEVEAIKDFYAGERSSMSLTLGLVVLFSILIVILITFLVLNYLIRRRITAPIDRLAAAAEEVMEGNLDVDIEVHEGDEFEVLERAFKEMVESFRTYIAKSVGEEQPD